VQYAISLGFGRHIIDIYITNPHVIEPLTTTVEVGFLFNGLATGLSRISFAVTLLKLTNGLYKHLIWFFIVSLAAITIPGLILPWVVCIPYRKNFDRNIPGTCMSTDITVNWNVGSTGKISRFPLKQLR
jgi:hypothetical protein